MLSNDDSNRACCFLFSVTLQGYEQIGRKIGQHFPPPTGRAFGHITTTRY